LFPDNKKPEQKWEQSQTANTYFDLKFMALPKGIGCKAFAFDRSRLKVIQNVAPCPNLTIGEN
jgi:hypothetical protein